MAAPVIMQVQLRARLAKLASSLFVQISLTTSMVASNPVIVACSDVTGAVFVSGFILVIAAWMFRAGMADMLDRAVDEEAQFLILRTLTGGMIEFGGAGMNGLQTFESTRNYVVFSSAS